MCIRDSSLIRYSLIIGLGFSASQLVILIGINVFKLVNLLSEIKLIAIMAAVSLQYIGNTFFGSKRDK